MFWAVAGSVSALTPTGMVAPASSVRPPAAVPAAAAKSMADDSSGMRRGTVEAVSVGTGSFHVYGQKLTFDAQRVRVFDRAGKPSSIYALKTGAKVRFTLDATDPMHRRVAVVYID